MAIGRIDTEQALSNFVQQVMRGGIARLAKLAGIDFGTGTLAYPGGSDQTTALVVPHALGVVPATVLVGDGDSGNINHCSAYTLTATDFTARARRTDGASPAASNVTFFWVAFV